MLYTLYVISETNYTFDGICLKAILVLGDFYIKVISTYKFIGPSLPKLHKAKVDSVFGFSVGGISVFCSLLDTSCSL